MGIEVSDKKVVTINDAHQNGVDTSVEANPTGIRFKGMPVLFAYSRNSKGGRRDDGNPLIHALKGRKGFSILPFWENLLLARCKEILEKGKDELRGFDLCVLVPSSSSFCRRFGELVSAASDAPILDATFVRKKSVGEVLVEGKAALAGIRPGLRRQLTAQLHGWEKADPTALYQAKEVDVGLRHLFGPFALGDGGPDLSGKQVLIVDDLFASGSSLLSMRRIMHDQLGAEVAGVCFLSGA